MYHEVAIYYTSSSSREGQIVYSVATQTGNVSVTTITKNILLLLPRRP